MQVLTLRVLDAYIRRPPDGIIMIVAGQLRSLYSSRDLVVCGSIMVTAPHYPAAKSALFPVWA